MNTLPLHPAIVHLPLALAALMPLIALGFAWALWTGRIGRRGWLGLVALQLLLVGGGLAAMNTGEREEDRVESVVPNAALHRHEEYAEQFVWAAALTAGLGVLVVAFRRPKVAAGLAFATMAASVVVTGLALRVGHAGGQLVYVHNAGAAYTSGQRSGDAEPSISARQDATGRADRRAPRDDDDR